MKKLLTLVIAGGMLAFYACGPSAEEIAAKEKAKQDSIHAADSVAAAQAAAIEKAKQDSIAVVEAAAKAAADSARVADSLAAAKKGGTKPKPKPKADAPKKVGGTRGGN